MDATLAACNGSDTAFDLAFSPKIQDMQAMIRRYCNVCPIKDMCLREAIRTDAYGVWGGTIREYRTNLTFMKASL